MNIPEDLQERFELFRQKLENKTGVHTPDGMALMFLLDEAQGSIDKWDKLRNEVKKWKNVSTEYSEIASKEKLKIVLTQQLSLEGAFELVLAKMQELEPDIQELKTIPPKDLKASTTNKAGYIANWLHKVQKCTCAQVAYCPSCVKNVEESLEELKVLLDWIRQARRPK